MKSTDRVRPHNLEVEESLISSVIIDNGQYEHCSDLGAHEFYNPGNQKIWEAITALLTKNKPADLVTLAVELKNRGQLEYVGGAGYLAKIADTAPLTLNTKSYADIISDAAIKRAIVNLGAQIQEKALGRVDVEQLISFVQAESLKLQQSKRGDNICFMRDIIDAHISQIERDISTEHNRGLLLGFSRIDKIMDIQGPKLIIVAGRPSMGKTAFAVTCMRNLSRQGTPSGFLSIEMGKKEILNRWLAIEANLNSMRFSLYKGLQDRELRDLTDAAGMMYEWPIQIDDTGSISIDDVERKCRKMFKAGAQTIFIDQLSKIRGRSGDRFTDYTLNCNRIADLKKELEIPIFLLAQISRGVEQRVDKRPSLSDLKNTGALEEDADIVMLLHRPEYYETDQHKKAAIKDHAEINIAKNRNGACFLDSGIRFEHSRSMFYQQDEGGYGN